MMAWFDIGTYLIVGIATWKLAHLTAVENGPGFIFKIFRQDIAQRYGMESWQSEGSRCVLCQSVWYAALFTVLLYHQEGWQVWIVTWLALAGIASLVHILAYK